MIAGHRINDPGTARELPENGWCDAVAMGRALIADPQLPEKSFAGSEAKIVHCVACGQCCFDAALLRELAPDQVLLATGGQALAPPIPGGKLPNVVQAWELLQGQVPTGHKVVVIGGGAVGVEVVLLLAEQRTLSAEVLKFLLVHRAEEPNELYRLATTGGKQVTIVEMLDKLGRNFGKATRWTMLQDLQRFGVASWTGTRVEAITADCVLVAGEAGTEPIPADTVVLAAGTLADNPLQEVCEALGFPCWVVGDAGQPALVFDAAHQGYRAGSEVA